MKSGLIIYVVGEEPPNWDAAFESMVIKKNTKVDLVEIITANTGHFDVLDAWWSLLTKGMKRVSCMIGEFSPAGNLTLTSRELHLCG
ncbi:MAG: hypothetical protein DRH90_06060 [Deltaproteobacteria bacterium]|nr:MAG: hypothetical protein DRH90_06060 [Deltaproteobacteria bacterium]RLC17376.1 MAG: hypothetical protein DRI24_05930 [Deltaproteobacteria bacterium]